MSHPGQGSNGVQRSTRKAKSEVHPGTGGISSRDMSIVEWLEYHHDQGKALVEMYRDNVDTVFRRQVNQFKHKFSPDNLAHPRRTKAVVHQLHHIFSKTIKDLSELDSTMLKEFKESFPGVEEDWFNNDACSTVSSSSINGDINSSSLEQTTSKNSFSDNNRSREMINNTLSTTSASSYANGSSVIEENQKNSTDSLSSTTTSDAEDENQTQQLSEERPESDGEGYNSDKTVYVNSQYKKQTKKSSTSTAAAVIKQEAIQDKKGTKICKEDLENKKSTSLKKTDYSKEAPDSSDTDCEENPATEEGALNDEHAANADELEDQTIVSQSLLETVSFDQSYDERFDQNIVPDSEEDNVNTESDVDLPTLAVEIHTDLNNEQDLDEESPNKDPPSPSNTVVVPVSHKDSDDLCLTDILGEEENITTSSSDKIENKFDLIKTVKIEENEKLQKSDKRTLDDKSTTNIIAIIDDEMPSTSKKVATELARNQRRQKRKGTLSNLSKDEATARRGVLDSSSDDDVDNDRVSRSKNIRKTKTVTNDLKDEKVVSKNDPKLQPGMSFVKIIKIDTHIEQELKAVGFVKTQSPNKYQGEGDDEADTDSDSSLSKAERAIKALMKYNAIISRRSVCKTSKTRSPTKEKLRKTKKHRRSSEDEALDERRSSDEEPEQDIAKVDTSLKTNESDHVDDNENLSELEDLDVPLNASSIKDGKVFTRTRETSEEKKADTKRKKLIYKTPRINLSSSSDDSEKEDRRMVLEKDSDDEDSVKDFKKTTPNKQKEDSNSDEDNIRKTRQAKKKKKLVLSDSENSKKDSDSDESIISVHSDSSENDSSGSDFAKKKSRKKGKRQHTSSDEDKKNKKKRRRIKEERDTDDTSKVDSDDSDIQEIPSSQKRKKIRDIIKDKKLNKSTRDAEKEEEERKKRVIEKQKLFNGVFETTISSEEGGKTKRLILDYDPETKEPVIEVDETIVEKLKPHQFEGIQFMYTTCFESVEMIKKGKPAGGCILAHCMGLGKTLQTVAFTHTVLNHKQITQIERVLIVCPLNTVNNWYKEYQQWLDDISVQSKSKIHALWDGKNITQRIDALRTWERRGGVGILHYDMFRTMVNSSTSGKGKGRKGKMKQAFKEVITRVLLDPGPDIIVCDEGHLLKNHKSKLSAALSQIKTVRRVVLTGTPLQNNLIEYHTMVDFVKPNLLGNIKEFTNRFVNPIKNGQCKDSGERDVKVMKRRAHVLHSKLDGCVQRLDYSVLVPYLPPKYEYCIIIKLSEKQKVLYKEYLRTQVDQMEKGKQLLKHYATLVKILAHPIVLTMKKDMDIVDSEEDDDEETGSLKDFIDDGSENESTTESGSDVEWLADEKKKIKTRSCKDTEIKDPDEGNSNGSATKSSLGNDWWCSHFENNEEMYDPNLSGKIIVLQEILKICETIGDRVLVFSQYLTTLNIIEEFLLEWDQTAMKAKKEDKTFPPTLSDSVSRWRSGIEYFRIDGKTKTDDRQRHCDTFNKKTAGRAKLFLISTKAGGLGINLFGANRVVIFDASWNPSNDMQSIFRVYRFGQQKPCYIYRFVAQATMEEKIYNRQVVKLSLSSRVIDEHQVERHFKFDDINEMYKFDPDEKTERPTPPLPKDRLLANLLISHKDWIDSYFEHDTLLINKEDEVLTEEERKQAWDEYKNENTRRDNPGVVDQATLYKIKFKLRERYPHGTEEQIHVTAINVLQRIGELRQMLNYLNLNVNQMPDNMKRDHEAKIKAHQDWISKALGTVETSSHPPQQVPLQINSGNIPDRNNPYPRASRRNPGVIRMPTAPTIEEDARLQMQRSFMQSIARNQVLGQPNRISGMTGYIQQQLANLANAASSSGQPSYARVLPYDPPNNSVEENLGGPDAPLTLE